MLSRLVLLWIGLGIGCGLFASIYWIVLSQIMRGFEPVHGLPLLLVMPMIGWLIGWIIHLLGNPGEIGLIIDNIHLNGGRLPMRENPSMILSSLLSIASGGSAGPEAPMVQVTGSIGTWLADRFHLTFPQYSISNIDDFVVAILCGVIGALAGWLFIKLFRSCDRLFHRLSGPIYPQMTLAGLGLALLAIAFPLTRFFGEHQLESIVIENFSLKALLGLAIAKMLAISITVTGGWRGGIIIPLFFVGACLGKAMAIADPEQSTIHSWHAEAFY